MVYGDWAVQLDFMKPIFDASVSCMAHRQPRLHAGNIDANWHAVLRCAYGYADYLAHFRDLWTRAMRGFIQSAGPGDVLVFAPELLSGSVLLRTGMFLSPQGRPVEEDDRYAQALIYQVSRGNASRWLR